MANRNGINFDRYKDQDILVDDHPPKGEVLAIMTPDELAYMLKVTDEADMIANNHNIPRDFVIKSAHDVRAAWGNLMIKYDINPGINIAFCQWTGKIFSRGF